MEKQRTLFRSLAIVLVAAVLAILVLPGLAFADYQKMDPPPDADKPADGSRSNTCWLATAANMLAGADYGDGATVQDRAEDIYDEMFAHFGNVAGWTDTAISWWLQSAHNTWAGLNPYTVVTVYGHKTLPTGERYPWANPNGAQFIGNELRRCEMVGLSISWPTADATIGRGGHAITCWGDSGDPPELTGNPAQVIVTDSDTDTGGDVQTYNYDAYNNPNPGGPDEGNAWYIDYTASHPYIKHIVTLCPTDDPTDDVRTQKVVDSETIHQSSETPATDLHYQVYTDVNILTYRTTIDWETENSPTIVEWEDDWAGRHWWGITVDWDLSDNPVPYCSDVTIYTEFVEPSWNRIFCKDKHFTYPSEPPLPFPPFGWGIVTPELDLDDIYLPNMSGGYVVGGFDIFADPGDQDPIDSYRFLHEYDYFQDPELHYFSLEGTNATPYYVGNLRFGHSYGFLEADSLLEFQDWMTSVPGILELYQGEPITVDLDWEGLLPYPLGDGPDFSLTVDSTAGGSVTTPGEGVFGYDEEEMVDLEATPDTGYDFVSWTGDVGTIAAVGSANTTITMNGDYEITANFEYVGDDNGCPGQGSLADVLPFGLVSAGIVVTWAMKRRRRVL